MHERYYERWVRHARANGQEMHKRCMSDVRATSERCMSDPWAIYERCTYERCMSNILAVYVAMYDTQQYSSWVRISSRAVLLYRDVVFGANYRFRWRAKKKKKKKCYIRQGQKNAMGSMQKKTQDIYSYLVFNICFDDLLKQYFCLHTKKHYYLGPKTTVCSSSKTV